MLALRSWTRAAEYNAHVAWWLTAKLDKNNKHMYEPGFVLEEGLTADENATLRKMLDGRGVQPFPASMLQELRDATKLPGASLATLVQKYRQQGNVGKVLFGVSKQPAKSRASAKPAAQVQAQKKEACADVEIAFLISEGYAADLARQAVTKCRDLTESLDFCVAHSDNATSSSHFQASLAEVVRYFNYMRCAEVVPKPQWNQLLQAGKRRMKKSDSYLPASHTFESYITRMQQVQPNSTFEIIDSGIRTDGQHSNACFWLATVVGWSQLTPRFFEDDDELGAIQMQVLYLSRTPVL